MINKDWRITWKSWHFKHKTGTHIIIIIVDVKCRFSIQKSVKLSYDIQILKVGILASKDTYTNLPSTSFPYAFIFETPAVIATIKRGKPIGKEVSKKAKQQKLSQSLFALIRLHSISDSIEDATHVLRIRPYTCCSTTTTN